MESLLLPELVAEASSWNPGHWVVVIPDGLTLTRADKGRIAIAGDGLRFLGDVLGLGGTLATGKGLQGGFVSAASRAPTNILPSVAAGGFGGSAAAGSTANLFRLY